MPTYLLTYSAPFEFDDDDSQGGSHEIGWTKDSKQELCVNGRYSDRRLIREAEIWAEKQEQVLCGKQVKPQLISLHRVINKWSKT